MYYLTFFLLFFYITINGVLAQEPDWIDYSTRLEKYPEQDFLSAYLTEENFGDHPVMELEQKLLTIAKQQISESIVVTVKGSQQIQIESTPSQTIEKFRANLISISQIELVGLQQKMHYDARKKTAYVFAYVSKKSLASYYYTKYSSITLQIQERLKQTQELISEDKKLEAWKKCLNVYTQCGLLKNTLSILTVLDATYKAEILKTIQLEELILKDLDALYSTQANSTSELAQILSNQLVQHLPDEYANLKFPVWTLGNTGIVSDFSLQMKALITKSFSTNKKYHIFEQTADSTANLIIFKGIYWVAGDLIQVVLNAENQHTGEILSSAEATIHRSILEDKEIAYLPENLAITLEKQSLLSQNQPQNEGLALDIQSNKGKENLFYKAGEEAFFYVRVNRSCYIRLFYHLADGNTVLLLDNYYLDASKVNQWYQIPEVFECVAPFGAEILQVQASTEKFPLLMGYAQENYTVVGKDLKDCLLVSRGLKGKKGLAQAEQSLVITTLEK